jgi:proteasome lid subunit RPN8/RPN11
MSHIRFRMSNRPAFHYHESAVLKGRFAGAMILLAQHEFEQLKLLAEASYPEEFCAILLGRRDPAGSRVTRLLPTPNVHANPRRAYSISPAAVIAAQRKSREHDLQILGFVHSHPDHTAKPSPADLDQALWMGCLYGIVSVRTGSFAEMAFYRLEGEHLDDRHFVPLELQLDMDV